VVEGILMEMAEVVGLKIEEEEKELIVMMDLVVQYLVDLLVDVWVVKKIVYSSVCFCNTMS
jgi:hypothetical protein